MPGAALEEILDEGVKCLPPEEQRQLRGVLNDEALNGVLGLLLAVGLLYLLEARDLIPPTERQRLRGLLNRAAVDSGLVKRVEIVGAVRGKYARLRVSSEAFAAQKQKEIELEDRL